MDLTRTGQFALARPGTVMFGAQLVVAWPDLGSGGQLRVATGPHPASGPYAPSIASLPDVTHAEPAVASFNGRLWLALVGTDGLIHLLSSADGSTFDQRLDLPDAASAGVSLGATGSQLFLAWNDPATQVVVASTQDGANLDRRVLTQRSSETPGLTAFVHPFHGEAVSLAWVGSDFHLRMATGPASNLGALSSDPPPLPLSLDAPPSIWAYRPVIEQHSEIAIGYAEHTSRDVALVSADVDGSSTHFGIPDTRALPAAAGPALADDGGVLILAYVDGGAGRELVVADHDAVFELPDELRKVIGDTCDPTVCRADPRLVCVVGDEFELKQVPARIANAYRGHLILTPADGEGVIGTILRSVTPAQFYDHMGIMIEDNVTIRHCTEAKNRLIDKEDYYEQEILGNTLPLNGLRADHVKYGWPGPITQSIQNGFFDGWNDGANPEWSYWTFHPGEYLDPHDEPHARGFIDPERTNDGYPITNLQLAPAYRDDHSGPVYPQVVKPPPQYTDTPWVRWLLGRIADEAMAIRGHYRFFAYSHADVAWDPHRFALPEGDGSWDQLPDGADWAAGTPGIVCSTFVWLAARNALDPLRPHVYLELEPDTTAEQARGQTSPPTIDGLYRYTEAERATSGQALHDWITGRVTNTVKRKLDDMFPRLSIFETGALIGALTAVNPLAGAAALALAPILQSPDLTSGILLALTDMPEHVANGICNAFANDAPDNVTGQDWSSPGDGVSVSPDDMGWFWDPPDETSDFRRGPYGYRETALIANPRLEDVPVGRLALSPGVAHVHGQVAYQGQSIIGAEVKIGCHKTFTNQDGFTLTVAASPPGGAQLIEAGAYALDAGGTGQWPRARIHKELPPGNVSVGTIQLDEPPDWRRRVEVHGSVEMVHQVLFGHDSRDRQQFSDTKFLQYNPDWAKAKPGYTDQVTATFGKDSERCGGEVAHLEGTITLRIDLAVVVDWKFQLIDGNDVQVQAGGQKVVMAGGSTTITADLKDADEPPDRAHLELTIDNTRNPI